MDGKKIKEGKNPREAEFVSLVRKLIKIIDCQRRREKKDKKFDSMQFENKKEKWISSSDREKEKCNCETHAEIQR